MIYLIKNKKYLFNFLKFPIKLLLIVYGVSSNNVAAEVDSFKYSLQNLIAITTEKSILLLKDHSLQKIPVSKKCLITIDDNNVVFVANDTLIGKIEYLHQHPFVNPVLVNWQGPRNETLEKFFYLDKHIYLATQHYLYRLDGAKLQTLDSDPKGLAVFIGKESVYVIKYNHTITIFKRNSRASMPFNDNLLSKNEIIDFTEVLVPVKMRAPVYLRWWAWTVYVLLVLFITYLYWRKRQRGFEEEKTKLELIINQRTAELTREKEKTDELLANLLPKDTVDELKSTGKATSQKFEMVTVLFSDIQGFTKIAEQMNPDKLIDELDNVFFHFDSVVEKYNIEKIKTIGDAYMCAGGIPYKNRTNPVEVVLAALEMQEYMRQLKQKDLNIWDLRIGVHTGGVIAGVVGHKRMSYDIWGDTVNTASRMESSGQPGKVNISGQTYEMIKEFFICEYRGKMPVKYKGDIDMYFVKGIRPELSIDLKMVPNKRFFIQLQILRLLDLEEFVVNRLDDELPLNMYFHNSAHTKEIYTLTELIGRGEGISQEELLLVRTAALLLNTGFIYVYDNYENESTRFAREMLPKFKYTNEQIETVCNLILSMRFTDILKSKNEGILLDACNNYLGRVDYLKHSLTLYKEVKERVPSLSEKEWLYHDLRRVEHYHFYTETAKLLREVPIEAQVQKIKEYAKFHEQTI